MARVKVVIKAINAIKTGNVMVEAVMPKVMATNPMVMVKAVKVIAQAARAIGKAIKVMFKVTKVMVKASNGGRPIGQCLTELKRTWRTCRKLMIGML